MAREHCGKRTETTRSLDVTNKTDNHHRGSLKNSDSLDNLLLVDLGPGLVNLTHDVTHTSLVGEEGGEVGLGRGVIILGEGSDASTVVGSALAGKKSQRPMAGSLELTVRHIC